MNREQFDKESELLSLSREQDETNELFAKMQNMASQEGWYRYTPQQLANRMPTQQLNKTQLNAMYGRNPGIIYPLSNGLIDFKRQ